MSRLKLFPLLLLFVQLYGVPEEIPWFTGTLLTPVKQVVLPGHVSFQTYLFATKINGTYNDDWQPIHAPTLWSMNQYNELEIGILDFLDVVLAPNWYVNTSNGYTSTRFADFIFQVDIQLIANREDPRFPKLLLQLSETFPTGQYQKLDPKKNLADASGGGTYSTGAGLTAAKIFEFGSHHFLDLQFNTSYYINTAVHVEGFNVYGGGKGTEGTVHPGNIWTTYFSFEYSLTQAWSLASDFVYTYRNKDHFSGCTGFNPDGTSASIPRPHSNQFIFAPQIEYGLSANMGLIGAAWMTLAGQNGSRFTGGILSFISVF